MSATRRAAILAAAAMLAACGTPRGHTVANPETILFGFDTQPFDAAGVETSASLARRAALGGSGSVDVAGHADTAGDPRYNVWLAERRARFVRGELIARGVPPETISVASLGESDLAVPTGDGQRERENRRVTVTLGGDGALPPPVEDRPIRFPLPQAPALE